jgi:predicted ArsR family transcriptional regulator
MNEPAPIEIHKALADDTRYRLYRYLRLSGRPVPVRELATRLGLHANTIRPHLRRLVEAGLVAAEARRGPSSVGRPQTVYTAVGGGGREGRDYRLFADILATLVAGSRARNGAQQLAREWGDFLVTRHASPPGARRPGPNLAALREALAEAGFDPRFRRRGNRSVEIALRGCPFRDLLEGMLEGSRPRLHLRAFEPLADRGSVCRVVAGS